RSATQQNARVGIGKLHDDGFARLVQFFGAVGQDNASPILERRRLEPPVNEQREITVLFIRPQVLFALRFAHRVIIDDAIDDFPMPIVPFRDFPTGQIATVEQGYKPRRCLSKKLALPGDEAKYGSRYA